MVQKSLTRLKKISTKNRLFLTYDANQLRCIRALPEFRKRIDRLVAFSRYVTLETNSSYNSS